MMGLLPPIVFVVLGWLGDGGPIEAEKLQPGEYVGSVVVTAKADQKIYKVTFRVSEDGSVTGGRIDGSRMTVIYEKEDGVWRVEANISDFAKTLGVNSEVKFKGDSTKIKISVSPKAPKDDGQGMIRGPGYLLEHRPSRANLKSLGATSVFFAYRLKGEKPVVDGQDREEKTGEPHPR